MCVSLFRGTWRWSDGSESSFRFSKPQEPSYHDQDCVSAIYQDDSGVSQSMMQAGTLKTIQPSTVYVTGNLILICENMTWMEALSYCQENYMDLVFITEQSTQDLVAQMAQNSTSSHIWLGLRYTCTYDLWFWSGSSADCYQNWAPGQGPPERAYQCGVTGAMLTTEGQQWVGLPERRQLNIICQDCAG
ncbi:lithostathine-2 [Hippocampus zosterae]|uniref:lithostathine-2 n=1 Tax=Hippocampus zosterae TaxID=109293 RepID=UPI00223E3792|nr:lithostathine-2 [Hippocampus zosterae]